MAIKTFNPTTPSRRNMTVLNYQGTVCLIFSSESLLHFLFHQPGGKVGLNHVKGGISHIQNKSMKF